jgi:hypothetical protein
MSPDVHSDDHTGGGRVAGDKQDTIVVPMRCSLNARPFRVIFSREHPHDPYIITDIRAGSSLSSAAPSGRAKNKQAKGAAEAGTTPAGGSLSLDAGELLWFGLRCPHCDDGRTMIECPGCDSLCCSGSLQDRLDGSYFTCGNCGTKGRLGGGEIERIGAQRAGGAPLALPEPKKGLLGGARRLLPRGKK